MTIEGEIPKKLIIEGKLRHQFYGSDGDLYFVDDFKVEPEGAYEPHVHKGETSPLPLNYIFGDVYNKKRVRITIEKLDPEEEGVVR